jgi:hypothetical protein
MHPILFEAAIMSNHIWKLALWLTLCAGACASDLPTAPSDDLLKVYAQLRALHGSDQWAVTENAEWQRDAATVTFVDGHLSFAEPVAGRVLAAYFKGNGTIQIKAPTPALQRQLARYAGSPVRPVFQEEFKEAEFFFTDDSWKQLQKLLYIRPGADARAATKALEAAQKKYAAHILGQISNLAARMLADLTDPSSKGFFLADFKSHRYGDLLYQISWNRDSLLYASCYFANDEEVMLRFYRPGGFQSCCGWVGFHRAEEYGRTAWPEHRTLLAHCRQENIDADLTQDNRLSATASMEIEVPGGTARVLPFCLDGALRISSIQDAQGRKLPFIQEAQELGSGPWVILPEPAAPGKLYNLKIAYQEERAKPFPIVRYEKAAICPPIYHVLRLVRWFPRFGAYDDRTHYTLHFLSPKRSQLLAAGRLVKSTQEKQALETDWDSDVPANVVGFAYGDFAEKSQSDDNLTVNAYRPSVVSVGGPPSLLGGGEDIRLERQLDDTAGISYRALRLYQYYFGPIPFKTVSIVQYPFESSADRQDWPALVSLAYTVGSGGILLGLSYGPVGPRYPVWGYPLWEYYDVSVAREMAYQWWGLMVGCKTYRDEWLSKGFAEFSEGLYVRKFQPKDLRAFWDMNRLELFTKDITGHPRVDLGPLYLNEQLHFGRGTGDPYYLINYKAAYVLEMLRVLFEDPRQAEPDARFIAMMHDYTSTFANRNASTADFQRIVEKHMGEPMDWFFNEWVYGMEIPEYTFHYELEPGDGGKTTVRLSLRQDGVSDQFRMRVPVYVTSEKNVQLLGLYAIKGLSTVNADVSLPFRPHKVTLDEFHQILAIEHP